MVIKISTQHTQKQILAPSMQQSIEVLMLPLADLNLAIEQELQNNPLLEINQDDHEDTANQSEEIYKKLDYATRTLKPKTTNFLDDEDIEEQPIKKEETLEEKLLRQLRTELSDPLEIKIGEFIIGNLDEDGYLKVTCQEIAQAAETQDLKLVEHILSIIQAFEPSGLAARTLEECLTLQVQAKYNGHHQLVYEIINQCLRNLGSKKYSEIAKKLHTSVDKVIEATKIISSLDPKPARNYRPIKPNLYIKPDITITKEAEDHFRIHVNHFGIPVLYINPTYKNMLQRKDINPEEKEFIREKIKNALYFIKSIEQRGHTIQAIAEYILKKQKNFFTKGTMALVPMTLKDVATALERNESTISRAVNNKYIDTPQGLFPLKFFFAPGIPEKNGGHASSISSRSVKEEIKEMIDNEDKVSPLSDQDIQKHFSSRGVTIARRTIGKYRLQLNILPSHLRKA